MAMSSADSCVSSPASPIGFEGYEKRLEITFSDAPVFEDPCGRGLRALSREQIDSFLDLARCTIVSQLSNESFDSYVLSESSLFVYPHKVVLKTCGTTKLLLAIPRILELAAGLSLLYYMMTCVRSFNPFKIEIYLKDLQEISKINQDMVQKYFDMVVSLLVNKEKRPKCEKIRVGKHYMVMRFCVSLFSINIVIIYGIYIYISNPHLIIYIYNICLESSWFWRSSKVS
jgi:hypothetical protein